MKKYIVYLLLFIVLSLGIFLRVQNLNTWPREGATFDEFAWTFLGLSIIDTGIPTSWSPHKAYKTRVQYINPHKTSFFLVTPYLEHPPLFGVVAGSFAKLNGVSTFDDVTIQKIRPLSVILGAIAIIAVYLLAQIVCGTTIGLLSALVYAIMPTVVAGSRIVQNENFFIPFFLLSLYFITKFIRTDKKSFFIVSAMLAALLPLAKVPWIAAPVSIIGILLYAKKYRYAAIMGGLAIAGIVGYFLYGFYFDREVFLNLWKLQLARYDMKFNSVFAMFMDPLVTDRLFVDGWIYFGWGSLLLLFTKDIKKTYPIVFGFLAYMTIFIAAIPGEAGHGWYRYPFYPFLAISTGLFLYENIIKNQILSFLFFVTVGLSMLELTWARTFGFSYTVLRVYILASAFTMMPILVHNKILSRICIYLSYALLCIIFLLSCWAGIAYNEQ